MAIYHLSVKRFPRGKGPSSVGAAAYRSRSRLTCRRTGLVHNFKAKRGVGHTQIFGWNRDRSDLWNAAEKAEVKRNATTAREIQAAIPRELSNDSQLMLCSNFAQWLAQTFDVAVDMCLHDKEDKAKISNQPHVHFLMSSRRVTAHEDATRPFVFGEKTKEWDRICTKADRAAGFSDLDRDENGRGIYGVGCVHQVREQWERMANAFLQRSGSEQRIDRRSLIEQGIDREPVNENRAALEKAKAGIRTPQSEEMRKRRVRNVRRTIGQKPARTITAGVPDFDEAARPMRRRRAIATVSAPQEAPAVATLAAPKPSKPGMIAPSPAAGVRFRSVVDRCEEEARSRQKIEEKERRPPVPPKPKRNTPRL